ncbi:MAG TPA: DUF4173 domain-containing protein [Gemmatimonadaceae bacterium]|nr:DUF4173 domain-containing protein [Gemmatimonadaceae bacterium]
MTGYPLDLAATAPAPTHPSEPLRPGTQRAVLFTAGLLGVAGDSLLRDGPTGIGLPLWVGVFGLNAVSLAWKENRAIGREAAAWLMSAFAFSAALAWRNGDALQFFDFAATLACLALAAIALSSPTGAVWTRQVRTLVMAAINVARTALWGFAPLLLGIRSTEPEHASRRAGTWHTIARSAALGIVVLAIFGALLRGADPIFASIVSLPDFDLALTASHVIVSVFFAWLVAGWARGALREPRLGSEAPLPIPQLGSPEITTVLGALNVLFAAYVATQIAWFFGGENFLRAHTGLTAAAYARSGFFQMVTVVALVVPLLLSTRSLLRPEPALARRHTALSLPLLALVAAMVVSAALRMKLYVQFYGLTIDRFYPLVFMGWASVVLVAIACTVLRDRGGFVPALLMSGFAVLAALNFADPDAIVARVNVDRAARLGADKLDVPHLAQLRGTAVPLALSIVLDEARQTPAKDRCIAARMLLARWSRHPAPSLRATGDASWRLWNADDVMAMRSVSAKAHALRDVAHRSCAAARETTSELPAPQR